jgi:hypothetical protein
MNGWMSSSEVSLEVSHTDRKKRECGLLKGTDELAALKNPITSSIPMFSLRKSLEDLEAALEQFRNRGGS